jgi:DNA-binding GntR family transcriptional regulator
VRDSLIVLEALVGLMANLAAKRIEEGDNAARMREAFKRLLAFKDDGGTAAFLDERRSFYDTIIQIGGNHELKRMLPLMQIHLLRMQFQSYITPRDREKQFKEYRTITDTILAGDSIRAQKVAGLHVRRTRLSLMRLPDEAFPAIRS